MKFGFEKSNQKSKSRAEERISRRKFIADIASGGMAAGTTAGLLVAEYAAGLSNKHTERSPGHFKEQGRFEIEGTQVRWIGVTHSLGTFKAHETEIREQVHQAGLVALEYFDEGIAEYAKPDSKEEEVKNLYFQVSQFFASVGRVCAEEEKDIIVVNPDSVAAEAFQTFLLMGAPVGIMMKAMGDADARVPASRRAFIASLLAVPSVAAWASEAGVTDALLRSDGEARLPSAYTSGDMNSLGIRTVMDWRDAVTAEGITEALKEYGGEIEKGQNLLAYHGAAHKGAIGYLQDPKLRKKKEGLYAMRDLLGPHALRRYHFSREEKSWKELAEHTLA